MSKFKTNEEFFDFSKRLVVIPIEDLVRLLAKNELKLPLYVHRFLLKETIRSNVFEEKVYETYTDEQKYRLRGYDNFSIFLLEKMISAYNLDFDLPRYKEMLFNFLYLNKDLLNIKSNFFKDLEQLQYSYTVDLEVMKYENFMLLAKDMFYEAVGYIDGIPMDGYDEDMITSYTLGDLKSLGQKNNVNIPRRINKGKLIDILSAKFQLSDEEIAELNTKSVLELEIYAKDNGFKISIDLKKTDMIEFLKFALNIFHVEVSKDRFDYEIPLATEEEEVVDDIIEQVEEVKAQEEEVEEIFIPEEVADEVEEEVIVTIQETIEEDLSVEEEIIEEEIIVEEEVIEEEVVKEEPKKVFKEEIKEEPQEKKTKKQKKEEVKDEQAELPAIKEKDLEPTLADETLLTAEEKELLDEKINFIIKRYYKRRKRRRIVWTIVIILLIAVIGFAAYSYYYYTSLNPGELPFGLPVFWK